MKSFLLPPNILHLIFIHRLFISNDHMALWNKRPQYYSKCWLHMDKCRQLDIKILNHHVFLRLWKRPLNCNWIIKGVDQVLTTLFTCKNDTVSLITGISYIYAKYWSQSENKRVHHLFTKLLGRYVKTNLMCGRFCIYADCL